MDNVNFIIIDTEKYKLESQKKDYQDFLTRLKTFIALIGDSTTMNKWLLKPHQISAPICAKYGWICFEKDFLKCVACKAIVHGGLPKLWETESSVYNQCVEKIEDKLKTEHSAKCPWPTSPVPDRFFRMEISETKYMLREFSERFEGLAEIMKLIPVIVKPDPNDLELEWSDKYYCELAKSQNMELNISWVNSAILLAITGWSRSESQPETSLECQHCFRKIYLHFYALHSAEDSSPPKDQESEPAAKKAKTSPVLYPLREHRNWCKWNLDGICDQENAQDKGWKLYLNLIVKKIIKCQSDKVETLQTQIDRKNTVLQKLFNVVE